MQLQLLYNYTTTWQFNYKFKSAVTSLRWNNDDRLLISYSIYSKLDGMGQGILLIGQFDQQSSTK